ncbi:MAG TPA: hypothetical protein VIR81_07490 [Myxococcales bacterium]
MMKMFLSLAAGAAALTLASAALAAEPAQLSDSQMDGVTAGGTALANGVSLTLGEVLSNTYTKTSTNVVQMSNPSTWFGVAQSLSQGLAAGGINFDAASVSHADSTVSFP